MPRLRVTEPEALDDSSYTADMGYIEGFGYNLGE